MLYPEGKILTHLISLENGVCVFKTEIYDSENKLLSTGHAYEKENSTFINKTSYIENCETSSIGRALGMLGIGIDTSIASFEEVANAIQQQEGDKTISKVQADALYEMIKNQGIENDTVIAVIKEKGYNKLSEIQLKDYANIVNQLRNEGRN